MSGKLLTARLPVQFESRSILAIAMAALFHFSGIAGIIWGDRMLFISLTPLNFILMFGLVLWTNDGINQRWFSFFLLCSCCGFFAEMVGVNTGILFGEYQYGNNFGPKILGVPVLIAVNWFMVVYGAGNFLQFIKRHFNFNPHPLVEITFGALICTFFDWIMEPAAIKLGYWNWAYSDIPLMNYFTWFVLSGLMLALFFKLKFEVQLFPVILLLIQSIFFLLLR